MKKFGGVAFIVFLSLLTAGRAHGYQLETYSFTGPPVNNGTENKDCFRYVGGQFWFYFSFTDSLYYPSNKVHYFVFVGSNEAEPSRLALSASLITTLRGIGVGSNNVIVPSCQGASATAEFLGVSETRREPFHEVFREITYENYAGLVRGFGREPRPNTGERIGYLTVDLGAAGGSASISNMSNAFCPYDPASGNFICPSYPPISLYESSKALENVQVTPEPSPPLCQGIPYDPAAQCCEAGGPIHKILDEFDAPETIYACPQRFQRADFISRTTDGCSIVFGDNPTGGRNTSFATRDVNNPGPCDRHDFRYRACHTQDEGEPDRLKATYDFQLLDEMQAVCRNPANSRKETIICLIFADLYFGWFYASALSGGLLPDYYALDQSLACQCCP